ncbi:MAG TPA: two-component regulator propeller domain-containing protein [Thermoanaerobaculia bacterium]|nr:two-component regulator propeller domain-containing protein [Thermoanaerobaculia bacterium]
MRPLAWLIALSLGVFAQAAAALEADRAISQYARRAWRLDDGLPNSVVRGILQTPDGYIWLATYEGLARFNGHSFTRFDKKNLPALRRDTVLAFVQARDGALWVGTNGGGVGFLHGGTMRVLTVEDGLPSDIVAALAEGRDGTMWIGTSAGLAAYRNGRIEKVLSVKDGLRVASILAVAETPDGTLWIGTRGGGVSAMRNGRIVSAAGELAAAQVYALHVDRDGTVWLGTNQGLRNVRNGALTSEVVLDGEQVTTVLRDSDATLWAGTYSNGLFRIAGGNVDQFTTAAGLLNNSIRSLFEDAEKNLWVGSNGGVECLTRGKFIPFGSSEGLSNPYTRTVLQTRDNAVWVGTANGLTRLAGKERTIYTKKDGLANDYIFSLAEGADGAIWVGTPTGLSRLQNGRAVTYTDTDGLPSRSVRALLVDRSGILWIGTDRGLTRYRNGRFEPVMPGPDWDTTFVQTFAEGPDGSVWIGTDGMGIARYRNGAFTTWTEREGMHTHILALLVDVQGTLWAGTDSAGLIRMKDGRITRYTIDTGLFSEKVLQILDDHQGRLWFGAGRGIWSVSVRELTDVAEGRSARLTPLVFTTGDGIRSVECNGSVYPTAMRARDGRLWFPTVEGVATVMPRDVAVRKLRPPPVKIESVSIDGRTVEARGDVVIPAGAKQVEIRYAALTYAGADKVRFRYRLEGFDSGWVAAEGRPVAYYAGVPPGTYRFHVTAANADGVWSPAGASLDVRIRAAFFQTPWFRFLVVALLAGIAWLLWHRRVRSMKRREAELVKLVAERTRDIAQALVEAEAANRAKSIFMANVSHELRTPLNAIIGFSSILQRDGDKTFTERQIRFVNNIAVSGEHLLALINDILDLAKVEAGQMSLDLDPVSLGETFEGVARVLKGITMQRNIELQVDLPDDIGMITADAIKLKQIVYNLVANAVKFSPDGSTVRVEVRRVHAAESPLGRDAVIISVIDHGIGIAPEHQAVIFEEFRQVYEPLSKRPSGTGLGLTLVKKFVELHGGMVSVTSELGKGSTFVAALPQ